MAWRCNNLFSHLKWNQLHVNKSALWRQTALYRHGKKNAASKTSPSVCLFRSPTVLTDTGTCSSSNKKSVVTIYLFKRFIDGGSFLASNYSQHPTLNTCIYFHFGLTLVSGFYVLTNHKPIINEKMRLTREDSRRIYEDPPTPPPTWQRRATK